MAKMVNMKVEGNWGFKKMEARAKAGGWREKHEKGGG